MNELKIIPFRDIDKKSFLDYLNKDRVLNFWTLYGFQNLILDSNKFNIWVAHKNEKIIGYLGLFPDKGYVHTNGNSESISVLIRYLESDEYAFAIESNHFDSVSSIFKILEPVDPSSKGKITKFLVLKSENQTFKPLIRHPVKRLGMKDLKNISINLGEEYKESIENSIQKGIAYGALEKEKIISVATTSESIKDLAIIRGVYTKPSFRCKGFSTSTCSALITEIQKAGKEALIWVAEDNIPARKVYNKLALKNTEHIFLGFKGKRRITC
jgi:ribosomal protein S18 acetylase RimI-like enzyme